MQDANISCPLIKKESIAKGKLTKKNRMRLVEKMRKRKIKKIALIKFIKDMCLSPSK